MTKLAPACSELDTNQPQLVFYLNCLYYKTPHPCSNYIFYLVNDNHIVLYQHISIIGWVMYFYYLQMEIDNITMNQSRYNKIDYRMINEF